MECWLKSARRDVYIGVWTVCVCVIVCVCTCVFNLSLPCYCQIHIDIPRMTPESLVLQPKVTEVRWTEQTVLWIQLLCPVSNKLHTLRDSSPVWSGLFQLAQLQLLSCIHLVPFWWIYLPVMLLICGADTLKWCECGPTDVNVYSYLRPPLSPISEEITPFYL